jgi:hypothetical protein
MRAASINTVTSMQRAGSPLAVLKSVCGIGCDFRIPLLWFEDSNKY